MYLYVRIHSVRYVYVWSTQRLYCSIYVCMHVYCIKRMCNVFVFGHCWIGVCMKGMVCC